MVGQTHDRADTWQTIVGSDDGRADHGRPDYGRADTDHGRAGDVVSI